MRVSFGVNNQGNSVFKDMFNYPCSNYPMFISKTKPDTFESKSLKSKIKNNKKFIIAGAIIGAGILAAIAFKRNPASLLKPVNKPVQPSSTPVKASGLTEEMINSAKDFLIKDVQKTGEASVNGICFYGPDSIGKEKAISSFLSDLQNAGYTIENVPGINSSPLSEISKKIGELTKRAEERFRSDNTRTAIVVRDLDKIAADRRFCNGESSGVVSALLKMQDCRKRGYTWISEAVDVSKIDSAVTRTGRMEHKIPLMPSIQDSLSVWDEYIALIEKFKDGIKKETLLKEAGEIMSRKGL